MRARLPGLGGRDARGRTRLGWAGWELPSALARPPTVRGSGATSALARPPSLRGSERSSAFMAREEEGGLRPEGLGLGAPIAGSLNFAVRRRSPPWPGLRCTGQRSSLRDAEITGLTQKTVGALPSDMAHFQTLGKTGA